MTSSQTAPGASPDSEMIRCTCAGNAGSANSRAETLTSSLRVSPAPVPLRHLEARLLECPRADVDDRAGALGVGQELRREEQSPIGMVPANERLEPRHATGRAAHDRQVVEQQLAAGQRARELVVGDGRRGLLLGDLDARATTFAGAVPGGEGATEHVLGPFVGGEGEGDADARGHLGEPVDDE